MSIVDPRVLKPPFTPETIINRDYERGVLTEAITAYRPSNLHISGGHGTGKTLITRTTLDGHDDPIVPCYIPCTKQDTQYKVLKQIYSDLSDEQINSGYHTAQLQTRCSDLLTRDTVIVLDDVDFLLENDGNDLLYYLSRLEDHIRPSILTLSSTQTDLHATIDERTYSSLHPRHVLFDPYSQDTFCTILTKRVDAAFKPRFVEPDAIYTLASATTNVQLALQWLEVAAHHASGRITEALIQETRRAAINQYWDTLLQDFSIHHHLLLEAVMQLSEAGRYSVYSGKVYNRYEELCSGTGKTSVSRRRASDYIRHLELLGIINAEYHYGGENGKTREIQLVTYWS